MCFDMLNFGSLVKDDICELILLMHSQLLTKRLRLEMT